MRKYLVFFFLFILSSRAAYAADDYLSRFKQAGDYYRSGNFEKAVELYKDIFSHDQTNPELFYNLGNAYYKQGLTGKAIVNYERALRFAPRDVAARNNLDFVRKYLNEPELTFFESVRTWVLLITSLNTTALALSCLYTVLVAGIVLFLFFRIRWLVIFNIIAGILFITCSGLFALQYYDQVIKRWAVVTANSEARNGPGTENSVGFSVPEGRKVQVLGEENAWCAIGLSHEGLKGWIEKKSLEVI